MTKASEIETQKTDKSQISNLHTNQIVAKIFIFYTCESLHSRYTHIHSTHANYLIVKLHERNFTRRM